MGHAYNASKVIIYKILHVNNVRRNVKYVMMPITAKYVLLVIYGQINLKIILMIV